MNGWNETICLQQHLELLSQEPEEWKRRMQELKGPRDLLECSNARVQSELNDKGSQLNFLVETTLKVIHVPDLLTEIP